MRGTGAKGQPPPNKQTTNPPPAKPPNHHYPSQSIIPIPPIPVQKTTKQPTNNPLPPVGEGQGEGDRGQRAAPTNQTTNNNPLSPKPLQNLPIRPLREA